MSLSSGQIRLMQTNINERLKPRHRPTITVDGVYGPETRKAVHLVKYLLGFPLSSLDTGPSLWFRKVIQHPNRLRPPSYLARARSREKYLAEQAKARGNGQSRRGAFGLDWAWGTPSVPAMRAAGVRFAARYLSWDGSKNLTLAQAKQLAAAGIDCVVVWETSANRAAQGRKAGHDDALAALKQANGCGMPDRRPIYFAVDFDAAPSQVAEYFAGAASVLGANRVGVYGSARIVDGLVGGATCKWGWQTYAWSGGRVSPKAHLYQYSNGHRMAGVSCDYNKALADDFGHWRP